MSATVETFDKAAVHALQERDSLELARRFGVEWAQIGAFFAAAALLDHAVSYVLATWLVGLRQHGLALLGHDAAHGLFARNKRINGLIGNVLCFWPLGASLEGYRAFHLEHHRHLGGEGDPEMAVHAYALPLSRGRLALRAALDLLGLGAPLILSFISRLRPRRAAHAAAPIAFLAAFVLACVLLGQVWVAVVWLAGQMTSFVMAFRLRTATEHHAMRDGTHRFHASALSRYVYLPHNTHCHYEHHRYAAVPCHNLLRLRAMLDPAEPVHSEREVFERLASH